ncbi:HAMP domain-containing histidine kinase [Jiangella ureilytica]|uniref:histidine kinase n=1 Tax=Jiangella ureilytica TaxID=2530374 RepID=A0A4R4RPT1_9ACTN|nr:HAMP domain-containing sensor histidine kinase [Jiangella ureilytica]TDC51780.1 HAMP domain-containing histidine kinase [Jiangella ureilytica]
MRGVRGAGLNPARWPVRVRLTALYAGAFAVAGAVLVTVTYLLVSESLVRPNPPGADGGADGDADRFGRPLDIEAIRAAVDAYRNDVLDRLLLWSLIALAAGLVLAVCLGWLLAGRALRPLQRVTDTARRVADRNLHERIALQGPDDELKELADTFDAMLERLDRSFDAQRRFVANASHELRTPLAVNRTLLEVALGDPSVSDDLKRLAPTVLATNERSERLVEGLLTLARSEQAVTAPEPVDLREIADHVLQQERGEASARSVTVTADLEPAPTTGNAVLLERLAANLVRNAVVHGGDGAQVRVWTGLGAAGGVALQVENTGPVLAPYEVGGLFEPFRRGNGRTAGGDGVGLGLSIVRSVAHAHGGTATAHARDDGGLLVRVDLPAAAPR